MAYIQKVIPSPVLPEYFYINDFSGGMNNSSEILKDNELRDVLNMSFCDDVLLEKRLGQDYLDALVVYDNAETPLVDTISFLDYYRPYTTTKEMIRASNLKVYCGSTKIADVLGDVDGVNFKGKYVFADGSDLYVYGIFPQVDSTYVNIVGTPVETALIMKIVSPASDYTPLGSSHIVGVTKYDYDNFEVSYEPCTAEVSDPSKGANVVPSNIAYLVVHDGRLYASGNSEDDDNIFITDVENCYYFPVTLPMQIPPNSDKIRGIIVYNDVVVIGRINDIYVLGGKTNNPYLGYEMFYLKKLNTHTGFANNKAYSVINNYLFYLGSDGVVYGITSVNYEQQNLVTQIISKQLDLFKSPLNFTNNDLLTATSITFKNEWYLAIKDNVLIYNYKNKSWIRYNGFNARSFCVEDGVLYWGNTSGRVCKFATDYLDFDEPFINYMYSKRYDMELPSTYKQFREFYVVAQNDSTYRSDIRINFEIDYSDVLDDLQIITQKSVWGEAVWGVDRFINRDTSASLPIIIGRRGRSIIFKFINGYEVNNIVATYNDMVAIMPKYDYMLVKVSDTNKYYKYFDGEFVEMENKDLNQKMKIYQINGEYTLRGKR